MSATASVFARTGCAGTLAWRFAGWRAVEALPRPRQPLAQIASPAPPPETGFGYWAGNSELGEVVRSWV